MNTDNQMDNSRFVYGHQTFVQHPTTPSAAPATKRAAGTVGHSRAIAATGEQSGKMQLRSIKLEHVLLCLLLLLTLYTCWTKRNLERARRRLDELEWERQPAANVSQAKILCWILSVQSAEHLKKSQAVRDTWGRRCDKLIVVRNGTKVEELEAQGELTIPLASHVDSRRELWHKVVGAFTHIRARYLQQYDWFMKADDDTYVLLENLRPFLAKTSPVRPIYFGHKFKPFVSQGYMSGGSGYVLSREALRRLVDDGYSKGLSQCHLDKGMIEDMEMGFCLEALQVEAGDTRDPTGKPTFLALSPLALLNSKPDREANSWYYQYAFYGPPSTGQECCSSRPISFHYITPEQMYLIEWLLYRVRRPPGAIE